MKSKGFTLIECLLVLLLLSVSLLMTTSIFLQIAPINRQLSARKDQEWHVFLIQLERELKDCTFFHVNSHTLYLKNEKGQDVRINIINGRLRKQENNGFQPLLTEVADLAFEKKDEMIQFTVTFSNKEVRSGRWKIP